MSSKSIYKIEWDINEFERFKEIVQETRRRSESLANRIVKVVKQTLVHIKRHPEMFEMDSLKTDNDGSFRKFSAFHVRFVYKIEEKSIIIVRVRHSSAEPSEY